MPADPTTESVLPTPSHGEGSIPIGLPDQELGAEELLELLLQQQRVAQVGLISAGLSHDVNNHLHMIAGSAYLALQTHDPGQWRSALEQVQHQVDVLAETTRAFLGFVQRTAPDPAAVFRVSDVVERSLRLARPLTEDRGVTLTVGREADAAVRGDATLAIQVLVNLLVNAIQACEEARGNVAVTARRPTDGGVRIEIADDGPGIPEVVLARLFKPFVTSGDGSGGRGLGLFVVRHAVLRLGGTVHVRSSPEGTVFAVDLPLADGEYVF